MDYFDENMSGEIKIGDVVEILQKTVRSSVFPEQKIWLVFEEIPDRSDASGGEDTFLVSEIDEFGCAKKVSDGAKVCRPKRKSLKLVRKGSQSDFTHSLSVALDFARYNVSEQTKRNRSYG